MEQTATGQNKMRILSHIGTAIYGCLCLWLYYNQSVAVLVKGSEVPFQSDLPYHLSMVLEDGWYYSFTAYVYRFLDYIFAGSTVGIAVFLALVSVATVYATERLYCQLGGFARSSATLFAALSLNFVMPAYLSFVGEFRYVSYQSANIWHNSTYQCMKLVALIILIRYFEMEKTYREGIRWKDWMIFALLNIVCTGIKPSFLLAFSPIMGIYLLIDLVRGVPFKRVFAFGAALLPSGLVILWQQAVLFGEDTGNGITLRPWYSFSLHSNIPKLAVVCSALFTGCILITNVKAFYRNRQNLFVLLMAGLSFLEALCLVESGSRSVDGNFLWGYSLGLFAWFVASLVIWMKKYPSLFRNKISQSTWPGRAELSIGLLTGAAYLWQLYCGIYFFIRLVCGEGFFMR